VLKVNRGDSLQEQLTSFRERHQYSPFVVRVDRPSQKPEFYHSIHELNCGVMLDEQKSGELTDKHRCLTGKAFYSKECLILLRGYARILGLHIAERKEESQPITKLGKGFVVRGD
jgi:hypothetical protein